MEYPVWQQKYWPLSLSQWPFPLNQLEVLGLVRGASIYSKNLAKDIGQSLKSVVGGALKTYTELLELTADTATEKMEEK